MRGLAVIAAWLLSVGGLVLTGLIKAPPTLMTFSGYVAIVLSGMCLEYSTRMIRND